MASSRFSAAETGVLWDLEYCPIPVELTPALVSQNIKLALKNMGYTGEVSITAYSLTQQNEEDFKSAGINLCYPETRRVKRIMMFCDAYGFGADHRYEASNLMLILNDISEDRNYIAGLLELQGVENNILLAQPQNASGLLRTIPRSTGGSPLDNQRGRSQVSPTNNQSGSSQVVTPPTSSPRSKFSAAKTRVLWDLEYCPIPVELTPALVSQNIKLALKDMGYTGKVSITAYSLTEQNEEDFESAGIDLCYPEYRRVKRIFKLMAATRWQIQHCDEPTNFMLISCDISEDRAYLKSLLRLKEKENNILVAQPEAASGLLRTIPSSFWLWSSLSTGGSPLDNQSGSSQVATPCLTSSSHSKKSLRLADKKKKKPLVLKKKKKPLDKKRKRKTKD